MKRPREGRIPFVEIISDSDGETAAGAALPPQPGFPFLNQEPAWGQEVPDRVPLYTDRDLYDWWQTGTPLALIRLLRLILHSVAVRF